MFANWARVKNHLGLRENFSAKTAQKAKKTKKNEISKKA